LHSCGIGSPCLCLARADTGRKQERGRVRVRAGARGRMLPFIQNTEDFKLSHCLHVPLRHPWLPVFDFLPGIRLLVRSDFTGRNDMVLYSGGDFLLYGRVVPPQTPNRMAGAD